MLRNAVTCLLTEVDIAYWFAFPSDDVHACQANVTVPRHIHLQATCITHR